MEMRHNLSKAFYAALLGLIILPFQSCDDGFRAAKSLNTSSLVAPEEVPLDGLRAEGKVVYQNNCAACHGAHASSTKMGITLEGLNGAIAFVGPMAHLKNLSEREKEAVVASLNLMQISNKSNPFACNLSDDPAISETRRLSRREYLATLADLTAGYFNLSQIQSLVDSLPADTITASDIFDSVDSSVQPDHIRAQWAIAKRVGQALAANATWMQANLNCTYATQGMTTTCWNNLFARFGRSVYRRPLNSAEQTRFKTLYQSAGNNVAAGVQMVITAMLQSPHFLYKIEVSGTNVSNREDYVRLNEFEVASRLAFFATGRGPDKTLLDDASAGRLATNSGYQAAVNRLFQSAQAKAHVKEFYKQWLGYRSSGVPGHSDWFLGTVPRASIIPESATEMEQFVSHWTFEQPGTYKDLLTSERVSASGPALSRIYGTVGSGERPGILSRVGALLGMGNKNALVHRGLVVRKNILCDKIPAPVIADGQEALFEPAEPSAHESLRRQVEQRTSAPQCLSCHSRINPMGFVLENYDSLGRFQTIERVFDANGNMIATHPVNARVKPNIDSPNEPEVTGLKEMATAVADSTRGPACLTQQWFTYTRGREPTSGDSCSLNLMYSALMEESKGSATGDRPATILNFMKSMAFEPTFRNRKIGPIQ